MNIRGTCPDSVIYHGVNKLNNRSTVDRVSNFLAYSLKFAVTKICIEFLCSLRRTLFSVINVDGIKDACPCCQHQNYLITGPELQIVLNKDIQGIVDRYYEIVFVESDRDKGILCTVLLVKERSSLRIDIDTGKIDDRIIVLA